MSQSQTQRSSRVDLLHGSILKSLLLFALPIMASRVFQQIYNTMDTLIVGHTLGDSSIAAMGACSSIYEMMTGFTFGVGNGLAIVTARCFGRQETERMKKSVASCIVIGITVTLVVTVLQRFSCIRCCGC
jgi:Na+-driven multidrug efflux pump